MGLLNKRMPETEVTFDYSPALSNTYFDEPVYLKIVVRLNMNSEMYWTFLDMTLAKLDRIVDYDLMYADITTRATRKMEKQLQLK